AAGEAVHACTATENREDLGVVAAGVDADAGEVRCEIEGATAVGERGDVDVVELEYIGQGLTRRRRQQQAAVLRRGERGVMLQHLQPRVPGAVGGEQLVLELRGAVVGPVEERYAPVRRVSARASREIQGQNTLHGSRAPAAMNRCRCRMSRCLLKRL